MSRPQGRPRGPPPAGLKGFGSVGVAKPGGASLGKGGFGGFETARSKSGLAYIAERADLSAISDAHAVVSFKNLAKKDSTTKARALEELLAHAQAHPYSSSGGGVEDAILEAWVQCYPRLSIDDARRVRELAHTVQLALMQSARKRMERLVPKVASAWLAGTYDRDRAVAKAAADGLASFLTTDDKTTMFWRRLQPQILQDATAAMQETPATLSDLRSTTQDDADLKYHRVLYSSLSLVLALLRTLSVADTAGLAHAYTQFFAVEALWSRAALSPDSHVRRVTYELLLACLETRPDLLEAPAQLARLTKLLTQDAPKTSQAGSVVDYLRVLQTLTEAHPEIWADGGHPFMRLRPLIEKGSQGTAASPAAPSRNFWTQLDALFASMPPRDIAAEAASSVLASFRKGLSSRDEPQSNAIDGWTAYLSMVRRLVDVVTPDEARVALVEANVFPLLDRFLGPPPTDNGGTVWATGAHLPVLTRASLLVARPAYADIVASARREWDRLANNLAGRMANSLPEVSKAFTASQQAIAGEGDRWFTLVADIHRSVQQVEARQSTADGAAANLVEHVLEQPTLSLLQSAVDLLTKRNFKPFGAAQLVRAAFSHAPHVLQANETGTAMIASLFPVDDAEQLSLVVASPSASALLSCLRSMATIPAFHEQYTRIYAFILSLLLARKDAEPDTTANSIALLISDASDAALATSRRNSDLQEYLGGACFATAQGQLASWDLFHAVSAANALSAATAKKLAAALVRSLGGGDTANPAGVLTALETMATKTPGLLADDEELHLELVTKLLGMMEVHDTALSAKVHALRALVDGSSSSNSSNSRTRIGGGDAKGAQSTRLIKIVQDNLDSAGPNSLEIDTLVEQAASIAKSPNVTDEDRENLFPNTNIWMQAMQAFLATGSTGGLNLNPSLSLTSNVGGAYLLVPSSGQRAQARRQRPAVHRDRHGRSVPARMAAYTTQLLATVVDDDSVALAALPQEFQVELLYLLYLVAELGSDQVALSEAHSLWGDLTDPFVLAAAEDAIAAIRSTLAGVLQAGRSDSSASPLSDALVAAMLQQTQQPTALAVYTTRALSGLLQTRMEGRTFSATVDEAYVVKQNLWKTGAGTGTTLGALAFLSGYGEVLVASPSVSNFCNRLISDVAGANPRASSAKAQSTLETLVLLNACMAVYEVGALPTASNRLMFAVKQITSWFGRGDDGDDDDDDNDDNKEDAALDSRIAAESCRALQRLLPCIKDMYGPHWERSIKYSIGLWDQAAAVAAAPSSALDEHLPYVYASLKLMGALDALDEPNDDLEDTLALFSEAKWTGLRRLLLALAHRRPSAAAATAATSSTRTQPQSVVDALLSRMASKTPLHLLTADSADLYTLVASDSRDIQAAGYGFLHRALPAQQEELSFNTILEKKEARLPDELLSLLLGAPTLEAYPDDVLATFPTPVRGYLLAWRLVFDAFSTASAKVRSDYVAHLGSSSSHVAALLDFAFDVLGHSAARPLNLDKEGLADRASIAAYDLAAAEASRSDEAHMHQLLVHLYYLVLKYVPGLFKAWYTACRTKQTTVAVEAWTAKYVSALVVEEVLDDVAAWAASSEGRGGAAGSAASAAGDDDHDMTIKTNKRAREVVAGYEVDELTLSIALRLPANYPIDNVAVVGLNRVAVDEKKWQSWLMITQGVIAFANGSLVEGLAAFQRNVLGALQGHTECAICYSIISVEKRVPEKRCGTCKNMFHRSCLYKWFLSSNQNSCPLCRNPISFLGSEKFKRRDVEY
ncbi:hypothetical protein HMPREF1624_05708 [Sporothrix schenckii ATCC 58251]|uniref:E3 ubiquitin-protein ligase listerin n=1 Tax=Sporothrix schenckii (strain ATCC 58251 / de Perez 2211183) TaxID=1391915 RepID=U7PS21_SPOS1|nr:hypothetical protein HMPREF1624_05708 [Sporothrix schenckii ATCC 58251]